MKQLLITDSQIPANTKSIFDKRQIIPRADIESIDKSKEYDIILDGHDIQIFEQFPQGGRFRYFEQGGFDYKDINSVRDCLQELSIYEPEKPIAEVHQEPIDDGFMQADTLPISSPAPELEDEDVSFTDSPVLSIAEQVEILRPIHNNSKIKAGSIAELCMAMSNISQSHGLFVKDIITGLFASKLSKKELMYPDDAKHLFLTHFIDRLYIRSLVPTFDKKTGEQEFKESIKRASDKELGVIWQSIGKNSYFNSRKEMYENIPEWDGEERIGTFMKKYFNCDTNPNLFLLLMTCIISKIHNPTRNYVKWFWDFVSNSKDIGKTYLMKRIVGEEYYCEPSYSSGGRGMDDFYSQIYTGNKIVVCNDELQWEKDGLNWSKMKSFTTKSVDTFSRKFEQVETHHRSFVIVRTSNNVNTAPSVGERRQIIFQCNLPTYECRITEDLLDNYFFDQLKAEAKHYYVNNGYKIYELTPEDKKDIQNQTVLNHSSDTAEDYATEDFITYLLTGNSIDTEKYTCTNEVHKSEVGYIYFTHKNFIKWCEDNRVPKFSAPIWKNKIKHWQGMNQDTIIFDENKKTLMKTRNYKDVVALKKLSEKESEEVQEDIDMPY